MIRTWLILIGWICVFTLSARQTQQHQYMQEGKIEHHANSATVRANFPRPLWQAVTSVREEYGWLVSYEEPPFQSTYDLFDDTAPQWRASHPGARGVWTPVGGAFQSEYAEGPTTATSPEEEAQVLSKIVSDYNSSGNPGEFVLRKQLDGSFALVGISMRDDNGKVQAVNSVLDTQITLPTATRSAAGTIELILSTLSTSNGVQVKLGMEPSNIVNRRDVTIGGNSISARDLLLRTIEAINKKMTWDLNYSADMHAYYFNLSLAMRASYDALGNKRRFPVN